MTPIEEIQHQLLQLPPDKQQEVLDFVSFLQQQQRTAPSSQTDQHSLHQHSAFGSWQSRKIDPIDYQRRLRAEWEDRA